MLSMSAGWFFVVLSEAITVANQNISLPGIGSYLALAIAKTNTQAVIYAIITMFCNFSLRPIIISSHDRVGRKFKMEADDDSDGNTPWLSNYYNTRVYYNVLHVISRDVRCFRQ